MLSPEKQQQLESKTELNEQIVIIRHWVQTASGEFRELAVQGFGRWGGLPNQERLNRFEQQLSPDEKKELAGLTGPEHMRKLMELFQNHRAADAQKAIAPSHQSADSSTMPQNQNRLTMPRRRLPNSFCPLYCFVSIPQPPRNRRRRL